MSDQALTAHERREVILRAVAAQLSTAEEHWRVAGDHVRGPGTVAVVLGDACDEGSPQHVELGVALNLDRPDAPVVWDCAVGFARDERAAITHAVEIWDARTMPVIRELVSQHGEFATHLQPDDPDGLTGWHVIHGPLWGWSLAGEAEALQRWAVEHPILPVIAPAVIPAFDRPHLNGVRLFFGGTVEQPTAEVRVNGRPRAEASTLLAAASWPRPTSPGFLSAFALAVHPG